MAQNSVASNVLRLIIHVILRVFVRVFFGYTVRNRRQLRNLRGHLIVANHSSHLDVLALLAAFPLRRINNVRTVCAKDYFYTSPLRWLASFLVGNTIPMDRDRFDTRAIAYCRKLIGAGCNIILFPEGTRSRDGTMGPFKPGVGLLTLKYGLPVLPAMIKGTFRCWPRGAAFPRPGRVEVILGQPLRYKGSARRRCNWDSVAMDLERRVLNLDAHEENSARLRARSTGAKENSHDGHIAKQGDEAAYSYAGQA
jgi:1-acyl-sn-glycerol-3-phosphate acyltransferase